MPPENSEILLSSIEVYKTYGMEYLKKAIRRYSIDVDLANQAKKTALIAIDEYDKALERYHAYNKEMRNKKDVELHKKAILELKSEGMI